MRVQRENALDESKWKTEQYPCHQEEAMLEIVLKTDGFVNPLTGRAEAGACFDGTEKYRFLLWRDFNSTGKIVLFVMLNPSTATELVLDPTVRGCRERALRMGYGTLEVCNAFAIRSPDPKVLKKEQDPVHPLNDEWIEKRAKKAQLVVAAWGPHCKHLKRHEAVLKLLSRLCDVHCLTVTKDGYPGHPLYVPHAKLPRLYQAKNTIRTLESARRDLWEPAG